MNSQKIIVMGGSFNPPTMAHWKLMETVRQELNAEWGIFVPAVSRRKRAISRWAFG